MSATYGRTPGGWLWAVIEPVGAIALLAFIFALAFDAPALGHSFLMFYATGYLPFMMFLEVANKTANAVRFSRPLLTYPAVTPLDAIVARYALNLLTHLLVLAGVLIGIASAVDTGAYLDPVDLAVALALTAQLAAGVGVLNCALFHRFPLWERVWQIATRPLFLISGIFFLIEDIPADYRDIALMNPLLHITGEMRAALYPTYDANLANPLFVAMTGLVCLCVGLLVLRTTSRDLVNG
jgi:capsular polysaccharide transport system permease protein